MQAKNDEYRHVMAQINQLQDEWETAMTEAEVWEKKLAVRFTVFGLWITVG